MKRAFLLCVLVACVPASESQKPAGAAGFHTVPTPASQRQPFVTEDGWTVIVEDLVLRAYVSASPEEVKGDSYGGGSDNYLWNARDSVDLYAPALGIGRWSIHIELQGAYVGADFEEDDPFDLGVDPRIAARFKEPAPYEYNPFGGYDQGPLAIFIGHASKDGRNERFDLALSASYAGGNSTGVATQSVDVTENALSAKPITVDVQRMFLDRGHFVFQQIADADTNGDGVVTEAELQAVKNPCASCVQNGGEPGYDGTLLQGLSGRALTVWQY